MKSSPGWAGRHDGTIGIEGRWPARGGGWASSLARTAFPVKAFRWLDDRQRGAVVSTRPFGGAQVAHIQAPPVQVSQEGSAHDPGRFHLVHHVSGHGHYRCGKAAFRQHPGDVVLIDSEAPCSVIHPDGARIVRWSLPASALAPFLCAPRRTRVHRFAADEGLTAVLAQNMDTLARGNLQLDAQAESALVAHLCGLAGVALTRALRPGLQPRDHLRTLQRQRILNYLQANLHDPRLSARRAACALGISTRWLHALLQGSGTGFADLVAGQRLDQCMALLRDPAWNHASIAEIAFSTGFNDLSTFPRPLRGGARLGAAQASDGHRRGGRRMPETTLTTVATRQASTAMQATRNCSLAFPRAVQKFATQLLRANRHPM